MTTPPATPPLPEDWERQDSLNSFLLGVQLAGEAVKRGEPLPMWLRSTRERRDEP